MHTAQTAEQLDIKQEPQIAKTTKILEPEFRGAHAAPMGNTSFLGTPQNQNDETYHKQLLSQI